MRGARTWARDLPHGAKSQGAGRAGRTKSGPRVARHRLKWRRGRDSNPRYPSGYTPLAGERLRPLGHLSVEWSVTPAWAGNQPEFRQELIIGCLAMRGSVGFPCLHLAQACFSCGVCAVSPPDRTSISCRVFCKVGALRLVSICRRLACLQLFRAMAHWLRSLVARETQRCVIWMVWWPRKVWPRLKPIPA